MILAGGKSSRFKTKTSKVLYPICGRPAIHYLLDSLKPLKPASVVVVTSPTVQKEFEAACRDYRCTFAIQRKPLGSGDAVRAGLEKTPKKGRVLILYGDVPLLSSATILSLSDAASGADGVGSLLSMVLPDGGGYGRVISSAGRYAHRVVEARDCTAEELDIREVNAGVYCVDVPWLSAALKRVGRHNAQGEYYLTDIVALADEDQHPFVIVKTRDTRELLGINTRWEAAQIAKTKRLQIAERHMLAGVDIIDPEATYIDDGVQVGSGTTIHAGVHLMGKTCIGEDVTLNPYSVVQDAVVGRGSIVGPFGRLRPGAELSENVHIGNFVEVKKSKLAKGVKANHLTYIGDADIGSGTNVGCGTITCNYDGVNKHRTTIGKNVFIGSDVAFVAPVTVKDGATIGAGSVVTDTVPANALAVARGRQVTIKNWKRKKK